MCVLSCVHVALGLEVIAHLVDVLDWGLVLHVDCWLFLWVFGFECTELVVGLESSLHGTSRTEHHTNPLYSELVFD